MNASNSPALWTLTEARARLRDGSVTSEQLTSACLERIDATEPRLHALLSVRRDEALAEARALDKSGAPRGDLPLAGIPVTLKDALAATGMPTTAASRMLEHFVSPYDAFAVTRLKEAGAVILGKNNMDEFAMGSTTEHSAFQATGNPWNPDLVPGGSSGGSAASVASGQCFASLGSDTGGSIRQPASLCGCVGIKPTYGRVSRFGLLAYASSFDQIGVLSRSVEDAALMLGVIAGHDERDQTCLARPVPDYLAGLGQKDLRDLRLGLPKGFLDNAAVEPGVAAACRAAVAVARELGAECVEVELPHTEYAIAAYYILTTAEASSNLARFDGVRYGYRAEDPKDLDALYTRTRTEAFGLEVQRRILLGTYVLSAGYYDAYYRKAAQIRRLIRQDYDAALASCDAILAPVSPLVAWKRGSVTDPLQLYQMDIFTLGLNLAGLPGLALPVGFSNGLPVGMQLMGRPFDEALLLRAGKTLADALGTNGQHA